MSVTTTANAQTYTLHAVLADYNLHHSEDGIEDTSLNAHPPVQPTDSQHNPSWWPTDNRRVPAYRPINTELDQIQRRVYRSGVERVFVSVMFTGVLIESVREYASFLTWLRSLIRERRRLPESGEQQWADYGMFAIVLEENGDTGH
jgi:hypothetical protein